MVLRKLQRPIDKDIACHLLEGARLLAEGTLDIRLWGLLGNTDVRVEVDFRTFGLLEGIDKIKDLEIAYQYGQRLTI